jgi:HSP20 family protein
MSANPSNVPVQTSNAPRQVPSKEWRPFGSLRSEIDRLFEDFDRGFLGFPFRRSLSEWEPRWLGEMAPAVDIVEKDKAYEITAELPGPGSEQHRTQTFQWHADDQGREEAGNRGEEEEGLLRV